MKNILTILVIFSFSYCNSPEEKTEDLNLIFKSYDLSNQNVKTFHLSEELVEISGMAYSDEGRLFAHNDEQGIIFQLDPDNGEIIKSFSVGKERVDKDFEDITIINDDFYLVTSSGVVYKFKEADNGSYSDYEEYETFLSESNDVEGLCYYSITNSLLLACKEEPGGNLSNVRAVYSFNLNTMQLENEPELIISLDDLNNNYDINNFKPSAIEFNTGTSTFFILSPNSVIEVAQNSSIISAGLLSPNFHRQAEGLVFLEDNTMVISDEGRSGYGTITFYPPR